MASAQVALRICPNYDQELVETRVREAIELLGGMRRFVKSGQRVLLKVNLLSSSPPEKAIVTHPSVVRAVAKLVIEEGGKPIIADSPGGPFTEDRLTQTYRESGLADVADELGIELNLDTGYSQVGFAEGVILKRIDVIDIVRKVDVIIAFPKLKTHNLMTFTGATKIMFGIVPGLTKAGYHAKLKHTEQFAQMLLDLMAFSKPALFVMDAVVGMEGDGPSGGKPKQIGVVLASSSGIAMDTVATSLVAMDPMSVPMLRLARQAQVPGTSMRDIEVLGDAFSECLVRDFLPATKGGMDFSVLPGILRNVATNQLVPRPVPRRATCDGCGTCVVNCPVDAIRIVDKLAVVDERACIRCYCCHEMCPNQAIDLHQTALSRLIVGKPQRK